MNKTKSTIMMKDYVKIMCIKCEKNLSHKNHIMMAHNEILNIHIGVCRKCYNKYLELIRQ